MFGEISKPLILSMLVHVVALGGLFVFAPYVSTPRFSLPPAQMVQLVDLPSDGGGGSRAARETPQPTPTKPDPPPEAPKSEKPPEPKPPEAKAPEPKPAEPKPAEPKSAEPKPEKVEKAPPPKPKEPPLEPEMVLPTPKVKEPPKKEPPKREEKKPEPTPRPVLEKPPAKKKELPPPAQTAPEPAPQREAIARAQPERPGPGHGGRSGSGSGLALGGGSGMLSLDSANFPFSYYLRQVTGRIEENWMRPQQNLGRVVVYFRIKRDGTIVEPQIFESSRNQAVDMLAAGAIKRSEPFPPLPVEFGGDYLGIYLCFGLGGACPGQKEG
jgi:TonB family protein